jgi:arylsulfatase A-like enzyme
MPEIMKAAGYRTAAFTGGLDYMKIFGHMRGFETVADNPPFTKFAVTIPQAADWLSKNSDGRFFLFVHGYDPHPPFTPSNRFKGVFSSTAGRNVTVDPEFVYRGYRETNDKEMTVYYNKPTGFPLWNGGGASEPGGPPRKTTLTRDDIDYLRDLYDEEVMDVDQAVGDFLNSLKKELLDKTIVVVLSEHGEMFAKHGRFGRTGDIRGVLYDDVVHVPLMIRFPGVEGRRLHGLVQVVDIMPTLLEVLNIHAPAKIQGTSLTPLIDKNTPVNEFVYAGSRYNALVYRDAFPPYDIVTTNEYIRNDKWKLIHEILFNPKKGPAAKTSEETWELYDIKNDPGEAVNSAAAHPDIVKDLAARLNQWGESARKFVQGRPSARDIPKDVLQKAREHGYW